VTITTLAQYNVKPENAAAVRQLLLVAARHTRAEAGCLYFHAYLALEDRQQIVLIEGWKDREALDLHRRTKHFNKIVLAQIVPLLESRSVTFLAPAFEEEFE
jgi:quinol monooxygenase YgiN